MPIVFSFAVVLLYPKQGSAWASSAHMTRLRLGYVLVGLSKGCKEAGKYRRKGKINSIAATEAKLHSKPVHGTFWHSQSLFMLFKGDVYRWEPLMILSYAGEYGGWCKFWTADVYPDYMSVVRSSSSIDVTTAFGRLYVCMQKKHVISSIIWLMQILDSRQSHASFMQWGDSVVQNGTSSVESKAELTEAAVAEAVMAKADNKEKVLLQSILEHLQFRGEGGTLWASSMYLAEVLLLLQSPVHMRVLMDLAVH